jgi:hypothetical protein
VGGVGERGRPGVGERGRACRAGGPWEPLAGLAGDASLQLLMPATSRPCSAQAARGALGVLTGTKRGSSEGGRAAPNRNPGRVSGPRQRRQRDPVERDPVERNASRLTLHGRQLEGAPDLEADGHHDGCEHRERGEQQLSAVGRAGGAGGDGLRCAVVRCRCSPARKRGARGAAVFAMCAFVLPVRPR